MRLWHVDELEERKAALEAVAGVTPIGLRHNQNKVERMRRDGLVAFPKDLQIRRTEAKRSLLAAKSVEDLVEWSDGLYNPPAKFRSW